MVWICRMDIDLNMDMDMDMYMDMYMNTDMDMIIVGFCKGVKGLIGVKKKRYLGV
jgi:hypothetical protein